MITIFDIPQTDQSVYYLSQVFGWVGSILTPKEASVVLGTMFRVFNSVVLSVAALIILYTSVVGIMKTAAEGEFLGRGWSTLWTPLRMVLGIAALIPTQSGYSAIQIVMMWVVLQGIGAADLVWTTVLKYTKLMGSPYSTITVPGVSENSSIPTLFQMLVCQRTAHSRDPFERISGSTQGRYYCSTSGDNPTGFCGYSDADLTDLGGKNRSATSTEISGTSVYTFSLGPGGQCGTFNFCDVDKACAAQKSEAPITTGTTPQTTEQLTSSLETDIQCNACKNSIENLQAIINSFDAVAARFVELDITYRKFYKAETGTPDFVKKYCMAHGMSDEKTCCLKRERPSILKFGQMEPVPGTEQCGIKMEDLPASEDTNTDTNASTTTVNNLFWPYGLEPLTGKDFIKASIDRYVTGLTDAAAASISSRADKVVLGGSEEGDQILKQASDQGWIFAGAYYFWLSKQDKTNQTAATPPFTTAVGTGIEGSYRTNLIAGSNVANLANTSSQSTLTASVPPELSGLNQLSGGMNSAATGIMRSMMSNLTGGTSVQDNPELATDPLIRLQSLGNTLLIVAQVLFALVLAVSVAITIAGYINVFALGTGVTNPVGAAFTTLAIFFAPFFTIILGALFTFGALLSIYTPLIPYLIFTMGAVGWFILVIEAMIAAPLVAIGILLPGGQSEILGKAEGALMYAFGLFLRPSLMVFGMMAGMLLSIVVVTMINAAFLGVVASINENPGFVEMFLFMGAYVGLLLAALNKCFSLIHIIPDRVLRWIGGHPEDTSPGEGLTGAKGGVESVGGAQQKMGGEAYGRGAKGAGKGWKEIGARGAKKEKAEEDAGKLTEKGEGEGEGKKTDTETPEQ